MGISRIAREGSTRNQEGLAPSGRRELPGTPVWVKYPSLPCAGARACGVAKGGNLMRKSIVFTFMFMLSLLLGASYVPAGFAEDGSAEQAFPGRTGEPRTGLFETPWGRVELKYEVIDGQQVFEGDILLPAEVEDEDLHSEAAGVSALGRRWPDGVGPHGNSGLAQDTRVQQAIQHWQERTPLRFVIGATSGNRVRFVTPTDPNACSSLGIGMQGGAQVINLGDNCSVGNAKHEIGHAIGLFHE